MTSAAPMAEGSVVARLLATWADAGAAHRRLWASGPDEPRLLGYAFGAVALATLGTLAAGRLDPNVARLEDDVAWIVETVVAGIFFKLLFFYGIAALIRFATRAAGGAAGWRETRAAFFWTALAAAPAVMLTDAAAAGFAARGAEYAGSAIAILGQTAWAWLLSGALAAANGFRSALGVFAVFLAIFAGVSALLWGLA